jgi:hypothetical protein
MWRAICAGFVVTACVLTGCNKDSDNSTAPPVPNAPALPDTVKPHSSAAELNNRYSLDLKYDPITLTVPRSWELKSMDEGMVVVLEGDTPTDTVSITIAHARPISDTKMVPASMEVQQLEAAAKAAAAKHPDLIKGDVVRVIPGGRVIEQLTLDHPTATTQSTTEPASDATQTMQWIFTVCVPAPNGFTAYDLRFNGITLKNYKADQDFLRGIMNTLTLTAPTADPLPK